MTAEYDNCCNGEIINTQGDETRVKKFPIFLRAENRKVVTRLSFSPLLRFK